MKSSSKQDWIITWVLRAAVCSGVLAFAYYLSWWFDEAGRWRSPVLMLVLLCAVSYGGIQFVINWYLYLAARRPAAKPTEPPDMSVDVFVTTCGEPFELVENTLRAACKMRSKHTTWLLDDGADPQLAGLAKSLGAGYLTRSGQQDAKAGNLNAAMARTSGEIIVIFDVDHAPEPDFLERSLWPFADREVGFVQVMISFANVKESWVSNAAIETSLEYYNPTSLGADRIGGATLMGSNALIRRSALESIAGYQPGLAEDLATSIHLHAAGWKSAYIPEPLAPGLAPPSFAAWFIQQMKWARGVFEMLVASYPKLFGRLTWGQRLSYAFRMTRYWIGPVVAAHMFATIAVLIFGDAATRQAFHSYLYHIAPLLAADTVIRYLGLYKWRHHTLPRTSLLRAVVLVYATWPIYLLAWLMALLRVNLAFRPTPKSMQGRLHPVWLMPQGIAVLLLFGGLLFTVLVKDHRPSLLLLFALAQGVLQLFFLIRWMSADLMSRTDERSRISMMMEPFTRPLSQR
jgi:cellulose synthase (UDP-forming)